MPLTITFVAPDGHSCDTLALQQSVEWLAKLNASTKPSVVDSSGSKATVEDLETAQDQQQDQSQGSVQATIRRGRGGRRPGVASAEQQAAALEQDSAAQQPQTEQVQQQPQQPAASHAIPPGMSASPQPDQQPATAVAASAPAPAPIALPPGVAVTTAPAAAAPVVPPAQAAMPQVPPTPNGAEGALTMEDIRSLWASKNKAAFKIGRAEAWADGTPKPRFMTVEAMPKEIYERFAEELAAV